jgi:uncharacterized repeat protein (TIGR03837 family)
VPHLETPMRWDIFCKVIDNHGDLGVCWRLACQLAARGESARLWVDDGGALRWMAPSGRLGVEVVDWGTPAAVRAAVAEPPPDVLIEAFGCEPAPELIAHFVRHASASPAPQAWINLEYLSAEPYVERLHRLPSPVFKGPGAGWSKRFFYPGFTPATGGLLREPELAARQARFNRAAWLAGQQICRQEGERLVSLFCYEPPALADWLAQLAAAPGHTRLLVTAGRAAAAVRACLHDGLDDRGALSISFLPYLTQDDFDHLLWACDLNFVRGEDSLVRALWAGAPLVWQIYPQDDDAHHVKLGAWLDWLDAPPAMRAFHRIWNGFENGPLAPLPPLPPLPALPGPGSAADPWHETVRFARDRLYRQDDLLTQLMGLVAGSS